MISDLPSMGPRFKPPGRREIEASREERPPRFFDRDLLLPAIHAADDRMLVVILLGLNCAFYLDDSEGIELRHLHLDDNPPWHDFRRGKTHEPRRAVLWPETVAAIRRYLGSRQPAQSDEPKLLVNQLGCAYSKVSRSSALAVAFNRLLAEVGDRPEGASAGSLRHTAATVMALSPDQAMIDLVMGHASGSNGARQRNLHRSIYVQNLMHPVPDTATCPEPPSPPQSVRSDCSSGRGLVSCGPCVDPSVCW